MKPREYLRWQAMYRMEEEEQRERDWGRGRSDYYAAQTALQVQALTREVVRGFTAFGVFKDSTKYWKDLKIEQFLFDFTQEAKKAEKQREQTEQEKIDAMTDEEFAVYKVEWNRRKAERSMQMWGAGLGMTPEQIKESM